MSQLAASQHDQHDQPAHVQARRQLDLGLLIPQAGFGRTLAGLLIVVGIAAIAGVVVMGLSGSAEAAKATKTHALAGYHMGFLYVLGLSLGCLGLQMILQQFNAGWSATVRRQAETVASLIWVPFLLWIPIAVLETGVFKGYLFKWMNPAYTAGDPLYTEKAAFLNPFFWNIRGVTYFVLWICLATALYYLSRKQDQTGDRWLTAKARWISSWGLLLFALSTAFASFDWMMTLDYHWFSTMFGVYFFAGSIVTTIALLCVILTTLRLSGRLGPTFTQEHQHDLGKLLKAFTVFWAYITFCQYFLIWYSNIPEETAFYNLRNDGGYGPLFWVLAFGHFLAPFLILLFRGIKRNAHALRLVALWMMLMHAVDLFYMVRPQVKSVKVGDNLLIDILGILGPVLLFIGLVVWKMARAPLTPIKDPRLHEVLEHKNYV